MIRFLQLIRICSCGHKLFEISPIYTKLYRIDVAVSRRIDNVTWKANFPVWSVFLVGQRSLTCIKPLSVRVNVSPAFLEELSDHNELAWIKTLWDKDFCSCKLPISQVAITCKPTLSQHPMCEILVGAILTLAHFNVLSLDLANLHGRLTTKIETENWNKRPKIENSRIGVFYPLSFPDFSHSAWGWLLSLLQAGCEVAPWTVVWRESRRHSPSSSSQRGFDATVMSRCRYNAYRHMDGAP